MTKLYKRLRMRMIEMDMRQQDISDRLGRSRSYVSQRLLGNFDWEMKDVYGICKILQIPYGEIHLYFPEDGRADKSIKIIA